MALVRMSFKEDNSMKGPRECIDKLVQEFISGNPLDEKLAEEYQKTRTRLETAEQQELDNLFRQVQEAYSMRARYQQGQVQPRTYTAATAPLLEYDSRKDKKAA